MNKHTPGPWTITESSTHITVRNSSGDAVFHDDKRLDGVIGDARLIAEAPELLELVKYVMAELEERVPIGKQWRERARAAIARVWGA
jgi:hypothetical protein